MSSISITTHDSNPADEAACVDRGLDEHNRSAAPLDEVQPISCFARSESGQVVGGALGRRWGTSCELLQMWVDPAQRKRGIGARLVRAFEGHALGNGCKSCYLETFNFQAPEFYTALGYRVAWERSDFPHGIVKFHMLKDLDGDSRQDPGALRAGQAERTLMD